MAKKTDVKVIQQDDKPIPVEVLAQSIKAISDGIKKLRSGPLTDTALILLIQHASPTVGYQKVTIKHVRAVLDGMESLERTYLKKKG